MKMVSIIIATMALATGAEAQLIYDSVRVEVSAGPCPASWTLQSESVTTEDRFSVRVPVSIGGGGFNVTADFVNAIWPSDQNKAAAVSSGALQIFLGTTVQKSYCALLP